MYPALTVSKNWINADDELLWVGSIGGMEKELVEREGIAYREISAAGVHGVSLRKLPGNLSKLLSGFFQSRKILREFKPDAILFTGGFVAIPMALAGLKVPSLLYVPDIEPGLALKVLDHFADKTAITAEESRVYYKKQAHLVVTGYPVRDELSTWQRPEALQHFGLSPDLPTVLVTGGSSGARSLNQALLTIAPHLLEKCQIIHLTGKLDWESVQAETAQFSPRYKALPYLHEMGAAYAAADLVVSRAGASILGEYPAFGLPAILVPYPHAWRYQKVNADYLVKRGAALMLQDEHLESDLLPQVNALIGDPARLQDMRVAMHSLNQSQAASRISVLIRSIATKQTKVYQHD